MFLLKLGMAFFTVGWLIVTIFSAQLANTPEDLVAFVIASLIVLGGLHVIVWGVVFVFSRSIQYLRERD